MTEMPTKFCYSCGMPLNSDSQATSGNYCMYCTDEKGELKSRETVKQGIIQFIKSWQPDVNDEKVSARAEHYMLAMPAWAD